MKSGMEITIETNPVFQWCNESVAPIVVQSGGTSSGKTYSIVQYLFQVAISDPGTIVTVVGQDIPNLKIGAYRDAKEILYNNPHFEQELAFHNKTDRTITFNNGSVIEFNSYDDFQDAKSGKRDYLFMNEANGVSYEIFEELQVRTSKQAFIDFNPTASFWAHNKLWGRDDVEWYDSTFKDNYFLDLRIRDKILSYEPTEENIARGTANKYRWEVYGLGKIGRLEGLVFPDFEQTTEWPEEYKWRAFGLDFGFTNDPTAIVEVRYAHGCLYVAEWVYEPGLTNNDIRKKLAIYEFDKKMLIVADSAEPKSIEELKRTGWNVKGAKKGKDSVINGIDVIKRYPLLVHAKSINLIEEFSSYTWEKDKDGTALNKPVDRFNHGIDALRYAVTDKVNAKTIDTFLA